MKILGFILENFMRVRVVEIRPTNRITTITGRNGQGKTSTLTGLFATLCGRYATPDQPVRKGAKNAKGQVILGDANGDQLLIERIINPDRSTTLKLRPARAGRATGDEIKNPQHELDKLFGEMARDPLEFIQMKPKEQIEVLRKVVKLDVDLDAIAIENQRDFDERTAVNKEVKRLQGVLSAMVVQEGLPARKVDEEAIRKELEGAGAANRVVELARNEKAQLLNLRQQAGMKTARAADLVAAELLAIGELEAQLAAKREALISAKEEYVVATEAEFAAAEVYEEAPEPEFVDVSELMRQLNEAQLANREIAKRDQRDKVLEEVRGFERDASSLSRRIEDRNERKANAMREAKMPVDGLAFDEEQVRFNGIPLSQLGEAEQLRLSAQIMMAGKPTLRVLPIWRGEALDDDNIEMLRKVAEEQHFDVWMVKVDTSGKTGIVIEDGEVVGVNQ
jgi:hypothetical protein